MYLYFNPTLKVTYKKSLKAKSVMGIKTPIPYFNPIILVKINFCGLNPKISFYLAIYMFFIS